MLRPYVQIVLEHDRLPVERERGEGGVALERVEDAVDPLSEQQPELLERQIPLAVPVRVWDDEVAKVRHLGHAPSLLMGRRYDRRMRFETVLFDLDGTVVDSGGIILASMRHATRRCWGATIPTRS